jgi:hypothetical protein
MMQLVMTLMEEQATNIQRVGIRDAGGYSARNSSKGALIDEAARVFQAMSEGANVDSVREQVLRGSLLSQRSPQNRTRIWTLISQRYIFDKEPWLN